MSDQQQPPQPTLTELQLDALRELANVASGTAATAMSVLFGREVDISLAEANSLPLADAVDAYGMAEDTVTCISVPVEGDLAGLVLLLIECQAAHDLCSLLGVAPDSAVGHSALHEIGNIVATSYLNGLAAMTGLELLPCPPQLHVDMLGAMVSTALVQTVAGADHALLLDSDLRISGQPAPISVLLVPEGGIERLLAPLGLAGASGR